MGMGRRAAGWAIWACKRSAYLTIDRYERPRRETAGAFLYVPGESAGSPQNCMQAAGMGLGRISGSGTGLVREVGYRPRRSAMPGLPTSRPVLPTSRGFERTIRYIRHGLARSHHRRAAGAGLASEGHPAQLPWSDAGRHFPPVSLMRATYFSRKGCIRPRPRDSCGFLRMRISQETR